ncbi:MAG TPA: ankyrin repeat domain-containing protein, partial [Armatimonadota bacterium]|nr:ankyrin repeat domain-containing protein [Armatimonadota bacterium]
LSSAAEGGRLEAAKMLIALGAKVNAQGDFGATPLSIAVSNGHASVVKLVIDNGADVNLADKYGATPLHKATSAYTATVLIARGADVNAANEKGLTPLHMAAFYGYATVAKVLIQKGANITARTTATAYLQPDKTYADVVLPPGLTPREFAEKAGQTEVAKLLEKAEAAQAMPPETPQTP